jgi:hypothetical protein
MSKEPSARERARQKTLLRVVMIVLVCMAALALFAVPRLSLPVRLFVASTDLTAAAVLGLLVRQKFHGR